MQKHPRREEDKHKKRNASELGGGAEGEGLFQTKLEHTMKEFKFKGYVDKKMDIFERRDVERQKTSIKKREGTWKNSKLAKKACVNMNCVERHDARQYMMRD